VPERHITGDADLGVFGTCSIFSFGAFMESFQVDVISESEQTEDKLQKSKLIGDQRMPFVISASILFYRFVSLAFQFSFSSSCSQFCFL
jgi:hypothetical protein